jgi:sigma-B regulation protein RsbU (phosphoserine phosphatase)
LRGDVATLGPGDEAHDRHGLERLAALRAHGRRIGLLGLGPNESPSLEASEASAFVASALPLLALALEDGRAREELRRAQLKLAVQGFELKSLVELTRELSASSAEGAIQELVLTTVMAHFLVSRAALYAVGPEGLVLSRARGVRPGLGQGVVPLEETREALRRPALVSELPAGALRQRLEAARMVLAVPLAAGERVEGVLGVGARASGTPFSDEDREVAQALARQALAAIDNVRLQRVKDEKQRQDRELQVAREIQRSLLPSREPRLRGGFEVAGDSRPCYEVGGDAYDWIPLAGERLALVVADVSGKGTPASLLMASVHAFVHALAGTAGPVELVSRLNGFLYARTQSSRFVTLFYAELDPGSGRLVYVNAGHVPPYHLSAARAAGRLQEGGPALGLLPDAAYELGELALAGGDLVAVVTDGVSEAMSPEDCEFGDERVWEALRRGAGGSASGVLAGLVAAVDGWAGVRGDSDDLTAVILRAR